MLTSLDSGAVLISPENAELRPERTICITGHREKSILPYKDDPGNIHMTRAAVRLLLYRYIDMALEKGYTDFFSGLADGTDLWAAEYVLLKKESNSDIRLIGAMPFLRHSRFMHKDVRELLCNVEKKADCLVLLNSDPYVVYGKSGRQGTDADLYKVRNYYIADNSSAVLAFFDERNPRSGTAQTVNYALRQGKKVRSFGLSDVYSLMDEAGVSFRDIGRIVRELDNIF